MQRWWQQRRIDHQWQLKLSEIERQLSDLDGRLLVMSEQLAAIQAGGADMQLALRRSDEDAAHIEHLSHQFAFVSFLPSVAGVLLAIGVLAGSDVNLAPIPFLLVTAALILSVLSPVIMLLIDRWYRREAADRIELLRRRRA